MSCVIRLVEHAGQTIHPDGSATGPEGPISRAFVKRYDPDGNDGYGDLEITADPAKAQVYADLAEAMDAYRAQSTVRPLRADGQPNRPLLAFTATFEPFRG